tara:strand:+ start:1288 stop:5139 length:3852 start_codon:yes stop_codon:yes gene_type:complete
MDVIHNYLPELKQLLGLVPDKARNQAAGIDVDNIPAKSSSPSRRIHMKWDQCGHYDGLRTAKSIVRTIEGIRKRTGKRGFTWAKGSYCLVCAESEWVNSVAYKCLKQEFDLDKNPGVSLRKVLPGSGKRIVWTCPNDHERAVKVSDRVKGGMEGIDQEPSECKQCVDAIKAKIIDPAYELMLDLYAPVNSIPACEVRVLDNKKHYSWVCGNIKDPCTDINGERYVFQTVPSQMFENRLKESRGCTSCASNGVVAYSRSIAKHYPEIAKEFDYEQGLIDQSGRSHTPENTSPYSKYEFPWICSSCNHKWVATPNNRCGNDSGCPNCLLVSRLSRTGHTAMIEMLAELKKAGPVALGGFSPMDKLLFLACHPKKDSKYVRGIIQKINNGKLSIDDLVDIPDDTTSVKQFEDALNEMSDSANYEAEEPHDDLTDTYSEQSDLDGFTSETDVPSGQTVEDFLSKYNAISDKTYNLYVEDYGETTANEFIDYLIQNSVQEFFQHLDSGAENDLEEELDKVKRFPTDTALANLVTSKILEYGTFMGQLIQEMNSDSAWKNFKPKWMQLLAPIKLQDKKAIGLASYPGSGKTAAAILSAFHLRSRCILVVCPNSITKQWQRDIKELMPIANIAVKPLNANTKKWEPKWSKAKKGPKFVVINYDKFSGRNAATLADDFLDRFPVDLIINDEDHYHKERESTRTQNLSYLIDQSRRRADIEGRNLSVLAMSGTPIVNSTADAREILDCIRPEKYSDYPFYGKRFNPDHEIPSVHSLRSSKGLVGAAITHMHLVRQGIINPPADVDEDYREDIIPVPLPVNMVHDWQMTSAESLRRSDIASNPKLKAVFPFIGNGNKTIVYTRFVNGPGQGIIAKITRAIKERFPTLNVSSYYGSSVRGLDEALDGRVDVLIASDKIVEGIDGLQHKFNQLVFLDMPYTWSSFDQLRRRLLRIGQEDNVAVQIPMLGFLDHDTDEWNWLEENAYLRLLRKRELTDFTVYGKSEGIVKRLPDDNSIYEKLMDKADEFELEEAEVVLRPVPIFDSNAEGQSAAIGRRPRGEPSKFNSLTKTLEARDSGLTHSELQEDPTVLQGYLAELNGRLRLTWDVDPVEHFIKDLPNRDGIRIADFGAGDGSLFKRIKDKHRVFSFDHISANEDIVVCDIAAGVPLRDYQVEYVLFSLSLWGDDLRNLIREANRVLDKDGILYLYESKKRLLKDENGEPEPSVLANSIERLGFKVLAHEIIGENPQWIFLKAIKDLDVTELGDTSDVDPSIGFRKRKPKQNIALVSPSEWRS